MIKINVITSNLGWRNYIKNPNNFIDKKINIYNKNNKTFKNNIIYCTLLLSGSKEIKKLNFKFRKKNKSTDVLSFPFYKKKELRNILKKEKEIYLGDIIINLSKIRSRKNIENFKSEFNTLWVHGLVHLFGYDHKKEKDFKKMNIVEKNFLSFLN
ncbi:rRNA maturation RNase YbeY [Pelagibacteraceae bacterium]|jgi:probable rRNA maturation factor|nr:rRNA maturation RNase YbeY [Pelagibacteraceae bacterium]